MSFFSSARNCRFPAHLIEPVSSPRLLIFGFPSLQADIVPPGVLVREADSVAFHQQVQEEKRKSGRNEASVFVICHLSMMIGHLTALNLA